MYRYKERGTESKIGHCGFTSCKAAAFLLNFSKASWRNFIYRSRNTLKRHLRRKPFLSTKHKRDYLSSDSVSIQLKSGSPHIDNDASFGVLEKALLARRAVRVHYLPAGKTELVEHVLHPYAIFFRKEDWYLEARSNMSENASLTFKILRFQKVELTDETFELPPDFSLSENLGSRWELFSGEPINITLKIAVHNWHIWLRRKNAISPRDS